MSAPADVAMRGAGVTQNVTVRAAERDADGARVWRILGPVLAAGETYDLPRDWDEAAALGFWFASGHTVGVACDDHGDVFGGYFLRANGPGGGAHVANAGFVVDPHARGRGVAKALLAHAEQTARAQGFSAMVFNHVIASNTAAVRLWTKQGYETVGRVPKSFSHPTLGLVDQLVMYKELV